VATTATSQSNQIIFITRLINYRSLEIIPRMLDAKHVDSTLSISSITRLFVHLPILLCCLDTAIDVICAL